MKKSPKKSVKFADWSHEPFDKQIRVFRKTIENPFLTFSCLVLSSKGIFGP